MTKVIFLLEEYSMKVFLEGLLPRVFPQLQFLCISHQGKQDLEKSLPRKLRAWQEPGTRFIAVRDQDAGDCVTLKERLLKLRPEDKLEDLRVRIACHELEAWYFGDLQALAEVYGDDIRRRVEGKARFRNPDAIIQPSQVLVSLAPEFQKVSGGRALGARLSADRNMSHSFQVFLKAVRALMAKTPDEVA